MQDKEARKVIASSAFRRVLRIGVPATLETIFPWILRQLGVFQLATGSIAYWSVWLFDTTPKRLPGIILPVRN